MIEIWGTIRNRANADRPPGMLVDLFPHMELTRGQMARALREGSGGLANNNSGDRAGADVSGVNNRHKTLFESNLRVFGGSITLAILMATAITVAPTARNPLDSANPTSSGLGVVGSIPGKPSPLVGNGISVHPYVSDVNQGHPKMLNKITSVTAAAVVGIATTVTGAADLLVPGEYPTIQAAIDAAASGDHILVAPGIYRERVNLSGKAIQLTGVAGPNLTTIDGQNQGTVIVGSGEPATCVVRGFTIMNGIDISYSGGGGIALSGSSARLVNCVVRDNTADGPAWWSGGGFHSVGGAPTIEDCLFVNNRSNDQSSASAIYHYTGGSITVRRCTFDGNTSNYSGGIGSGPGHTIKCHSEYSALTVSIEECTFIRSTTGTATPLADVGGEILLNASGLECDVRACYFVAGYSGAPCAVGVAGGANALVSNSSICGYIQPTGNFGGGVMIVDCVVGSICADCDTNNIDDVLQIASGSVLDTNQNNIPDTCECIGDIDTDGAINGSDLGTMLAYWGSVTTESVSLASDLNADGVVNGSDLGVLLANWGACQG